MANEVASSTYNPLEVEHFCNGACPRCVEERTYPLREAKLRRSWIGFVAACIAACLSIGTMLALPSLTPVALWMIGACLVIVLISLIGIIKHAAWLNRADSNFLEEEMLKKRSYLANWKDESDIKEEERKDNQKALKGYLRAYNRLHQYYHFRPKLPA